MILLQQQLTEIPCGKLFMGAVSTRQGVPLSTMVFLPSLPGIVKAELTGTHIGWLVMLIQALPYSTCSLMENCWAFFLSCCCCPIVLMVMLSNWIPPALLW